MCHARNMLTKYGGFPLSFGPLPQPLLTRRTVFDSDNTLLPIFWAIQTKNKMAVAVISFSWITLEVSKTDNFDTFKVSLSRQELSNERTMIFVRQFWSFNYNDWGSGNFTNFRVDAGPLDHRDLTWVEMTYTKNCGISVGLFKQWKCPPEIVHRW